MTVNSIAEGNLNWLLQMKIEKMLKFEKILNVFETCLRPRRKSVEF